MSCLNVTSAWLSDVINARVFDFCAAFVATFNATSRMLISTMITEITMSISTIVKARRLAPDARDPDCGNLVAVMVIPSRGSRLEPEAAFHLRPDVYSVPPDTDSIIFTSGRNSASTIVPTAPPSTTTSSGSSMLTRPCTAASTSSS